MNENMLTGFICPECKHEGPFYIEATAEILVHDDGFDSDDIGDSGWNDGSKCICPECQHSGIVADFDRSYTKGKVEQSICPECKSEEISRLEMVFGHAAVMQDGKGGWDYDGSGTEVDWDSQIFTGIWMCNECFHEWGKFDEAALKTSLGKWAPGEHRDYGMEIFCHGVGTKLHHPIEAIIGWHGQLRSTRRPVDRRTLCGILYLTYALAQGRDPKFTRTILNWFDSHYPPGHPRRGYFAHLENDLTAFIKNTTLIKDTACIKERRKECRSGTPGGSKSRKKKKKKQKKS